MNLEPLFRAVEAFLERLEAIGWSAVAVAALCHVAKMVARSRAWRNVLAEAYPGSSVRWRSVFGAYVAAVGVNSILPARGGDVLKLYIARHRIEGSSYPTIAATLLVEAVFDTIVAATLLVWALSTGALPGSEALARLPSIDWLWLFKHPRLAAALGTALALAALIGLLFARRRIREFRARVQQGLTIVRRPRRYLYRVAAWQALDWALRLAAIYFFLRAFGLVENVHNALLVQVAQSVSTLLPLTPAGIGTEQALLVYVFRGTAAPGAVLSFSVGMKLVIVAVNLAVGFAAIFLMLRTTNWRRIVSAQPGINR